MEYSQLERIRNNKPLIQSITNSVTVNDCANIILAVGASPIMAHNENEVAEVQRSADGLLLNLGATDNYSSFIPAAISANDVGNPVVIDPVGVTISSFRRQFLFDLLDKVHIDCIRCNYGEAYAIATNAGLSEGLDSTLKLNTKDELDRFVGLLKDVSKKYGFIIAASGRDDIVVFKDDVAIIQSGDEYMKYVTGMGCMCSEVVCTFLAVDNSFESAKNAIEFYGECGKTAAKITAKSGTMTFRNNFIDCVSREGCLWVK